MTPREPGHSLDDVPDPVLVVDATTGEIQRVNEAACQLFDYPESALVGTTLAALTAGGDTPVTDDPSHPTTDSDGPQRCVWWVATGGGDTLTVAGRFVTASRDGSTAVLTLRERPDPGRVSPTLERGRDRYRTLFDNEELVLWEQDFSAARAYATDLADTGAKLGAYIEDNPEELLAIFERVEVHGVNQAALDFYGVESKEQLVANLDELMTPATREGLTEMWQAVVDGERYFCKECQFRPLDGDEVRHELMELYVPESHADDYSLVFTTGTDITGQKRRERELAEARDRYRRILGESTDYVLVHTAEGVIDYASPGIETALGYEPTDLVGTDAFEYVHPADRADVLGTFEEMLAAPDADTGVEYRVRAADGSYHWVEARGGDYTDDPLIGGVMVTIRNVGERKRYEQELRAQRDARSALQEELADAASVETFASAVCAELVAMDPVDWVRVGRVASNDGVEPLATAGCGDGSGGVSTDGGYLAAVREEGAETVPRPADADAGSMSGWTTDGTTEGTGTGAGDDPVQVPITYDGVTRGVLVAGVARGTLGDHLQDLLRESADVLGYAMANDERRQALAADEWVQLTITAETGETPLSRAAGATGTTATVDAAVPRDDGAVLCYLTVDDPGAFVAAASDCEGIERAERVGEGGSQVQVVATQAVPSVTVAEHGGNVDAARIDATTTSVTARFRDGTAFEPVLSALDEQFGEVATGEFNTAPTRSDRDDPLSGLSDRQREVLEVAYRGGYFEQPRAQNAGEVADQLGVARPTYGEILRTAQRNLLSELFEE
jgi:PAS domain S-box-containing protein